MFSSTAFVRPLFPLLANRLSFISNNIIMLLLVRGVYFALPRSAVDSTVSMNISLFEIPTMLFFLMYTAVLYTWYLIN